MGGACGFPGTTMQYRLRQSINGGASLPEMLMSSLLSQGLKFSTCIQSLSPFYLLINKLWMEHSGMWVLTSVWKVPRITPRWCFCVNLRCISYTSPVSDAFWELCNLTWLSIKKVWEFLGYYVITNEDLPNTIIMEAMESQHEHMYYFMNII